MGEHISFEDLSKFVWMEQINADTLALSLRVICHLMQCEDCTRRMEHLQKIYEDARFLRQRKVQLERVNRKLKEVNETVLSQRYRIDSFNTEKDD